MKTLKFLLLFEFLSAGFRNAKADQPTLSIAFNKVINSYLDIKNALVADDAATAQAKARTMVVALSTIPAKEMNAAQRKVWAEYLNKLTVDSRQISEQNKIDKKRERFATLSSNFMVVLKAFNINKTNLYKQYCPMKNSYWLSEASAVKNPYYGNSMLTCGTTQETFEAVK
jgi:hypothetical protein